MAEAPTNHSSAAQLPIPRNNKLIDLTCDEMVNAVVDMVEVVLHVAYAVVTDGVAASFRAT